MAQRNGTGMFPAREVVLKPHPVRLQPNAFPLLPLEEEGRLNDMPLRENFIERVLAVQFAAGRTARPHGPECQTRNLRRAAWSSSTPPTS